MKENEPTKDSLLISEIIPLKNFIQIAKTYGTL